MKILTAPGHAETTVKASRFIADALPAGSEDEAEEILLGIKKKHRDARHHCFAYVLAGNPLRQRSSDDGEPQGTAGKPILDVITGGDVAGCIVVVTRYFGGTLLGTGGLVRAYSSAAAGALENAETAECFLGRRAHIRADYRAYGKIKHFAAQHGIVVIKAEFNEEIDMSLILPEVQAQTLAASVREMAGRDIRLEDENILYASDSAGDIVIPTL